MTDKEIIESFGFEYKIDLDEWQKPMFDGTLCICESISSSSHFDLHYEDEESFFIPIVLGANTSMLKESLKCLQRDIKLSQLLGENKEHPFPYIIKKSLI